MLYVKMLVIICSACMLLVGCGKTEKREIHFPSIAQTVPMTVPVPEPLETETISTEPEEERYSPSNWSDYDRQWMLGCETMGWKFGEWMFKLGGLDPTKDGILLSHLSLGAPGLSSLAVEPERYLETWDGKEWTAVSQFPGKSRVVFEGGQEPEMEVLWQETWDRPLAPGYYRLGAYYTATMDSGDSYRQMCYAKFRIVDEEMEELVKQCQESLKVLLEQETFHIFRTDYMLQQRDREDPHYFTREVFKSGQDYYKDYRYYFYADNSEKGAQAELYRNGEGQHWNGMENGDRTWKPVDFLTSGDFSMEAFGLECEPDIMGTISKEGSTITAIIPTPAESFHQEILEQELVYRFDDAGNVKEITLNYQFVTGEKETEIKLEVMDTSEQKIRKIIDSQ